MATHRATAGALLLVGIVAVTGFALQRQASGALRREAHALQAEREQLTRVEAENARLKSAAVTVEERERLRSDQAAVIRLRAEVVGLRARVEERARRLQAADRSSVKE